MKQFTYTSYSIQVALLCNIIVSHILTNTQTHTRTHVGAARSVLLHPRCNDTSVKRLCEQIIIMIRVSSTRKVSDYSVLVFAGALFIAGCCEGWTGLAMQTTQQQQIRYTVLWTLVRKWDHPPLTPTVTRSRQCLRIRHRPSTSAHDFCRKNQKCACVCGNVCTVFMNIPVFVSVCIVRIENHLLIRNSDGFVSSIFAKIKPCHKRVHRE